MTIVSAPFTPETFSLTAQTEQELAYEFLSQTTWSEEAYLTFSEAFNRPIELSEGRLIILPMPTLEHQRIIRTLAFLFHHWLEQGKLGEMLFASHPVRLWRGKMREPDVMVWLTEHRDRMKNRASGPPDLAVEIHSPGNKEHDTQVKFAEYARAGIAEYWMIDPPARCVSVFVLDGEQCQLLAHFGAGDRTRSVVLPGFEVAVADLFSGE